jgi:hypothetical protein
MPTHNTVIDEIIENTPGRRGEMMKLLRRLIHEADPDIVEENKWKRPSNSLGTPTFEHNGIVCMVMALKGRVRLTMNDGAALPDPKHLYNAMLNGKSRAIDFPEGSTIDEAAVKAIIRAGVEMQLAKPAKK